MENRNLIYRLFFVFALLLPAVAWGEYLDRTDCDAIALADRVTNQTSCKQTTTTGGRTAGQLYNWTGAAWAAMGSSGLSTSADLAASMSDEVGTDKVVFNTNPTFVTNITTPKVTWTAGGIDLSGAGSPEGSVTAPIGSVYRRTDGGASTTLYVKESGVGNTGWSAYGPAGGAGAPSTAGYWTKTADGGLSDEFAMGSLATGLVRNTATTGVPTIATACTHYLDPTCVLSNANLPTTITGRTIDNSNTVSLLDSLLTICDNLDTTKCGRVQLSGLTTATTRSWTFPNADTRIMSDNDFAGTQLGRLSRTGSGLYSAFKDNFVATTAPNANDDTSVGYSIGSLWINTTADTFYVATDVTAAAANWLALGTTTEVDTFATVLARGRTDTTATTFATAVKFGGWAFYDDVSLGPIQACVVLGVENACNYIRKLAAGFYFEIQNSAGTSIFRVTESTGAITNATLDAEATGNALTIPAYWDLDLVGVTGGVASHVWNEDPLSTTCAPLAVTGTNRTTGVCTFPDSDGDYGRGLSKLLPTGYVAGSLIATVVWKTTGTGNARFQFQTKCYADDEADDAAMNTATVVTAAAGTSARPNMVTTGAITDTGCAAGELMRIRFFRNRTEASDSLNAALDAEKVFFKFRVTH